MGWINPSRALRLPDKSWNPESLNKQLQQFESSSNNKPIVGEDLVRVFHRLFYLQFFDSTNQFKKQCVEKVLLGIWEIFLHENDRS